VPPPNLCGDNHMIRDTKGRKWFMRFRQYREGWHWVAKNPNASDIFAKRCFPTKELALEDARSYLQGPDHAAQMQEYIRRLQQGRPWARQLAEEFAGSS
jgi:hypothetical protein